MHTAPRSLRGPVATLVFGVLILAFGVTPYWFRAERTPPIPDDLNQLEPVLSEFIQSHVEAVRQRPDDPEAHGKLGILYEAHGYTDLAMRCYANAAATDVEMPRWLYHWAVLAVESGSVEIAEKVLRDVIAKKPDYAPAHERLALLLLDRNAYEQAARSFKRVMELRPNEPEGYIGLARVKLRMSEERDAVDLLSRAVKIAPRSDAAQYLLHRANRRLGRVDQDGHPFAPSGKAEPSFVKDPWREAIDRAGATLVLRFDRAKVLQARGQVAEAARTLEELLANYPDDVRVLNELAHAYLRLQRPDDAMQLLNRSLQVDKDNARTHLGFAAVLQAKGDLPAALDYARQATRLAPDNARAFSANGKLLLQVRRYEEALTLFRKALQLAPSDPEVHGALGLTLVHLRRWEEAIEAYKKAVEFNPQSVANRHRLGLLYDRTGQVDKALATLRAALELDPENEQVRQALERVQARLRGG